jgi:hypothetical protein
VPAGADGGVVDEHVDAPEGAEGLVDESAAVVGLGDVGRDGEPVLRLGAEGECGVAERVGSSPGEDDGAALGEALGDGQSDARAGAGDDGDDGVIVGHG